jgi:hypothetical protein
VSVKAFHNQVIENLEKALKAAKEDPFNYRGALVPLVHVISAYGLPEFWIAFGEIEDTSLPITEREGFSTEPRKHVVITANQIIKECLGNFEEGYIVGKAKTIINAINKHGKRMVNIEKNRKALAAQVQPE